MSDSLGLRLRPQRHEESFLCSRLTSRCFRQRGDIHLEIAIGIYCIGSSKSVAANIICIWAHPSIISRMSFVSMGLSAMWRWDVERAKACTMFGFLQTPEYSNPTRKPFTSSRNMSSFSMTKIHVLHCSLRTFLNLLELCTL